jgi:dUTP pyrophosphatase
MKKIGLIKTSIHAVIPTKATNMSSGYDLYAFLGEDVQEPLILNPNQRFLIPTGIRIDMEFGLKDDKGETLQIIYDCDRFEAQVRSRSGLALKNGICVLNGIGTIDQDYKGEIKVILINLSDVPFEIRNHDRIAQLVFCPVINVEFKSVENFSKSERNEGGFGSTGK